MAFSPLIMRHNQQERNTKHIQCLTSNIIQLLYFIKKKTKTYMLIQGTVAFQFRRE